MPSFNQAAMRLGVSLAAILAFAPVAARADAPCPGGDPARFPDSPPVPTITSYTITRSTAPEGERDSGAHAATVIGGDLVEGEMRVDIRLSRDLPRDCPLSVGIVDPTVSSSDQRTGGGEVKNVFRITESDRVQVMAVRRTPTGYLTPLLYGDGTNRLVLRAKTLARFGDHTANLALRVDYGGPLYPFTLTRRGMPDFTATAAAATTRFGSTVELTATLPFTPGPGAIDDQMTYAVTPAGAGNFRRPNHLQSLAPTLADPLDADLTPRRSIVIFVPAALPKSVNAKITATLMGRSKSIPMTILPAPTPCKPQGDWEIVKGGLKLTLTNLGQLPCPRLQVVVTAPPLTVGVGSNSYWSNELPPAPEPVPSTGRMTLLAPPPTTASSASSGWTGSYTIAGPYPAAGLTVTATLRPADGSFPTITLPPLSVSAMAIGKTR